MICRLLIGGQKRPSCSGSMLSSKTMRVGLAYAASFLFTVAAIGNAYIQKKQFYPAVVYLSKSNSSLAVLAIQALVLLIIVAKLVRKLYFGQLRAAEVEHLIERSWYAVTETCLAFTVFREDFSPKFVALFTILLFIKAFHWLGEDRVDYMERSPVLGALFHLRIMATISTLTALDLFFIQHAFFITQTKGATVQLVFGFEYAILFTIVFTIVCKYFLHCIDLYDENPWENKAVYLLYLELITSAIKFTLYITFVILMSKFHTFPLFAVRPLYLTMRSFKKAVTDVTLSRRAIRHMNELYPNATPEELQGVDVCIICREEMETACKKLPCSHIFHESCLRSWFQRQQTCPTCRMEVLRLPNRNQPVIPVQQRVPAAPAAAAQPPVNHWEAFQAGMAAAAQNHQAFQQANQQRRAAADNQQAATPTAPTSAAPTPAANQQAPPAAAVNQNAAGQQPAAVPPGMPLPPFQPSGFPHLQAGGAAAGTAFTVPPPAFPPMPPMPPMFPAIFGNLIPPTMPSANIQALSEEELRQLEGEEREKVELRIQWLRDIQTLLDAAVEQMHQYSLVMPRSVHQNNHTTAPMPAGNSTNTTASTAPIPSTTTYTSSTTASTASGTSIPSTTTYTSSTTASLVTGHGGARAKSLPNNASLSPPQNTAYTDTTNVERENSLTGLTEESDIHDQQELRRRRLARFSTQTDTSSSPPN